MNKKRLISLFVALAMLLIPFAITSCGDEEEVGGGGVETEDHDLSPAFMGDHLTFGNETFVILTKNDRTKGQAFNVIDVVAENNLGDTSIVDAVQKRNALIEERFQIKIVREQTSAIASDAASAIEKADESYDAFMMSVNQGLSLALNGACINYADQDYIDLSSPWWDQGVINNLVLLGGTYIALGDINTVDNDGTWCVLFNKVILEAYGTTDAALYAKVKEGIGAQGGWTTEYMANLAKKSYKEDPNTKDKWRPTYSGSGTYGMFTQQEVATVLIQSSGNTPTKADSGMAGIVSNVNTPEFTEAIQAVYDFMGNRESADWYLDLDGVDDGSGDKWQTVARGGFMADKSAFYITHVGTIDLIREMKSDFGIIPVPKLTEFQEDYGNTIQYTNSQCYVVPYRLDEELNTKSCYILEALAYYSSTEFSETECLSYAFYTLCLQAKGTRDDDAWDMLDLIFDCRVFDLACALNLKDINNIIRNSTTGSSNNWVSQRDANLGSLNNEIGSKLEVLAKG